LPAEVKRNARRAFKLWKEDPFHPSLHFKRVATKEPIYSARIGIGWRALGVVSGQEILWFWIGSHADYDRLFDQL
jgi:hypothetical protein